MCQVSFTGISYRIIPHLSSVIYKKKSKVDRIVSEMGDSPLHLLVHWQEGEDELYGICRDASGGFIFVADRELSTDF